MYLKLRLSGIQYFIALPILQKKLEVRNEFCNNLSLLSCYLTKATEGNREDAETFWGKIKLINLLEKHSSKIYVFYLAIVFNQTSYFEGTGKGLAIICKNRIVTVLFFFSCATPFPPCPF